MIAQLEPQIKGELFMKDCLIAQSESQIKGELFIRDLELIMQLHRFWRSNFEEGSFQRKGIVLHASSDCCFSVRSR